MDILQIHKKKKVRERSVSIEIPHLGYCLDADKTRFTRQDLALKWAKKRIKRKLDVNDKIIIDKEKSRYVVRVMRRENDVIIRQPVLRQTGRAPSWAVIETIGQYTRGK